MKKGKTNFVIYAIREIFLVVIGILIAVSINNWNEARKEHKELGNILLNVKGDIQKDINKIDEVLEVYEKKQTFMNNVLDSKYSAKDYESSPELAFLILGYPEISFHKRGVSLLENYKGSTDKDRKKLTEEIIKFYNDQLWEIKVDDELRAEDFKENIRHWKNNTEWWSDYISLKITKDFIEYALDNKDYKSRVATARFYAFQVYLPEVIKFKKQGLELIERIEQMEAKK
jgi:hypothetical protein